MKDKLVPGGKVQEEIFTCTLLTGSSRVHFLGIARKDTLNLACTNLMFTDRHAICKCVYFQITVIKTLIRDQYIQCLWEERKKEAVGNEDEDHVKNMTLEKLHRWSSDCQQNAQQSRITWRPRWLGRRPEFLSQDIWGEAQEFTFLTSCSWY